VLFFAAFFGIASGSRGAGVSVAFAVAVVLGWAWISAMAARLRTELPDARG
jgi:cytochrome b